MNNLKPSEHERIGELLPWYVNKTLDNRERAMVERHLASCEGCQESIRLWSTVQSFVQQDAPVPIVPEPNSDALLDALDIGERGWLAGSRRSMILIAASVLIVISIVAALTTSDYLFPESPTKFETVISEPADNTVQYIIEMRFDSTTTPERRGRILDALGNVTLHTPLDAEVLTLHIEAGSLPELQARMDDVRTLPHVIDARIVAVHLPVE